MVNGNPVSVVCTLTMGTGSPSVYRSPRQLQQRAGCTQGGRDGGTVRGVWWDGYMYGYYGDGRVHGPCSWSMAHL